MVTIIAAMKIMTVSVALMHVLMNAFILWVITGKTFPLTMTI